MLKNKLMYSMLVIALVFCTLGIVSAQDTGPFAPALKLTVTQSPLAIYPPIIIYTAQFNEMPTMNTRDLLKVDFYHYSSNSTADKPEYLGYALFDRTGKAVLSKQIKPGSYIAIASVTINYGVIWSNKVPYKVP